MTVFGGVSRGSEAPQDDGRKLGTKRSLINSIDIILPLENTSEIEASRRLLMHVASHHRDDCQLVRVCLWYLAHTKFATDPLFCVLWATASNGETRDDCQEFHLEMALKQGGSKIAWCELAKDILLARRVDLQVVKRMVYGLVFPEQEDEELRYWKDFINKVILPSRNHNDRRNFCKKFFEEYGKRN